jgi:hypothetical protein
MIGRLETVKEEVTNIRNEFKLQWEREAEYRSKSESANSAAIRWLIVQIVIMVITCAWQLQQLQSFFVAKKIL